MVDPNEVGTCRICGGYTHAESICPKCWRKYEDREEEESDGAE